MEVLRRQYEDEVNRRRKTELDLAEARKKHEDELEQKDHHFKKMERFYKGELVTMRALYDDTKKAVQDIRGSDLATKHMDLSKKHTWLKDMYNALKNGDAGKAVRSVEEDLRKKDVEVQRLTRALGDMEVSHLELEKRLRNAESAPSLEKEAFAEAMNALGREKKVLENEKEAIQFDRGALESEKAALVEQNRVLEAEAAGVKRTYYEKLDRCLQRIWNLQDEVTRRQDENSELRSKVDFLEKE